MLWLGLGDATAHDFWIEPLNFRPKAGERVPLQLRVGQEFKGDAVLFLPESFERYIYVGGGVEAPVTGRRGDDPAGSIVAGTGLQVVGLHTKKFEVRFDSFAEFEAYLVKEGLERNLIAARKHSGSDRKIVEIYSRQAKSLVAGAANDAVDHVFGFPLELVAETSPYRERELRLRLLYLGRPLADALVVAFSKAEPANKLKARTDDHGRVTLVLPRAGVWLVTSVHMIPQPWYARADWESFWASLTFERPAR